MAARSRGSTPSGPDPMAGSRTPAPRAVKGTQLRCALRAPLTATPVSAPVQPSGPLTARRTTVEDHDMAEVIELETMEHWWCRQCGRWQVCDNRDLCAECSYMVGRRRRDRRTDRTRANDRVKAGDRR
jgi:hypothetical protein